MEKSMGRIGAFGVFLALIALGLCATTQAPPPPQTTKAPTAAPPKADVKSAPAATDAPAAQPPAPAPATPAPPVTPSKGQNYVVRIKNETLPNPEVDRINAIVKELGQDPLPPANQTKELMKATDKRIRNVTLYLNELTDAQKPKDFSFKPFNIFNVIVLQNPSVEILNEVKSFSEVEKVENVDDGFWINGKYAKIVDAENPKV